MVCGNQEWHLADPPASWANLGIEPHMTIYIEFELRPMEILVKVNNGEAEPDVYEEEEFDLTLSECRNLDDLTDAVMNNLSIHLGDSRSMWTASSRMISMKVFAVSFGK